MQIRGYRSYKFSDSVQNALEEAGEMSNNDVVTLYISTYHKDTDTWTKHIEKYKFDSTRAKYLIL